MKNKKWLLCFFITVLQAMEPPVEEKFQELPTNEQEVILELFKRDGDQDVFLLSIVVPRNFIEHSSPVLRDIIEDSIEEIPTIPLFVDDVPQVSLLYLKVIFKLIKQGSSLKNAVVQLLGNAPIDDILDMANTADFFGNKELITSIAPLLFNYIKDMVAYGKKAELLAFIDRIKSADIKSILGKLVTKELWHHEDQFIKITHDLQRRRPGRMVSFRLENASGSYYLSKISCAYIDNSVFLTLMNGRVVDLFKFEQQQLSYVKSIIDYRLEKPLFIESKRLLLILLFNEIVLFNTNNFDEPPQHVRWNNPDGIYATAYGQKIYISDKDGFHLITIENLLKGNLIIEKTIPLKGFKGAVSPVDEDVVARYIHNRITIKNHDELFGYETEAAIELMQFSSEGSLLAVVDFNKSIYIFDVTSGRKMYRFLAEHFYTNEDPYLIKPTIFFSKDNKYLISSFYLGITEEYKSKLIGKPRSIQVWDLKSGKLLQEIQTNDVSISALYILPDNKHISYITLRQGQGYYLTVVEFELYSRNVFKQLPLPSLLLLWCAIKDDAKNKPILRSDLEYEYFQQIPLALLNYFFERNEEHGVIGFTIPQEELQAKRPSKRKRIIPLGEQKSLGASGRERLQRKKSRQAIAEIPEEIPPVKEKEKEKEHE